MFRKILIGGLLLGLVAIIGAGAVIRTMDRTGNSFQTVSQTRDQANDSAAPNTGTNQFGNGQGRGAGGYGQGAAAQGVQWTTLQGSVTSVGQYAMTVQASNGEQVIIQNRPWSFALEQKFSAKAGDEIKMNGFYQNGLFEIGQMQNLSNGSTAQVRDQSGRPGWAGRGNGGNGWNGNGG